MAAGRVLTERDAQNAQAVRWLLSISMEGDSEAMNKRMRLTKLEATIKPQPTTAIQKRDDGPGVVTQERIARAFKAIAAAKAAAEARGETIPPVDWSVPIEDNPRLERCRLAVLKARQAASERGQP